MPQLSTSVGSCQRPLLHQHPWRRARPWVAPMPRRGQPRIRRQLLRPPACEFLPCPSPPPPRDTLACYEFVPPVERPPLCSWFQDAVRGIVQCVECAPFLQLVALRGGGPPQLTVVPIAEVVADPQLWPCVAESMGGGQQDAIILVEQVPTHSDFGGRAAAEAAVASAAAAGERTEHGWVCTPALVGMAADVAAHTAAASLTRSTAAGSSCSSVTASTVKRALDSARKLQWEGAGGGRPSPPATACCWRDAAAPPAPDCSREPCFYGVVVQSRRDRAVEGCYLLKTSWQDHALSFSLTRICQGGQLERQFISAWLQQ